MSNEAQMLIVAAYTDPNVAQQDFDGLVAKVTAKDVATKGMILVAKDADGQVTVADTGNHLGRKGAGWGGGVGVLVGLFAPPMLAAVAVGGAAGGLVGHFAGHKLTEAIQSKVSEQLQPGTAVLIGVHPAAQRMAVRCANSPEAVGSLAPS